MCHQVSGITFQTAAQSLVKLAAKHKTAAAAELCVLFFVVVGFLFILFFFNALSLNWIIGHQEQLVHNVDAAATVKGHWVTCKCLDCSFARRIRK